MKNIIVGTAGHIDHGKTALVKALTGIDADRLAEEKRRGITIDLGFAHLQLTPDIRLGFVDVPGHERFVRNMLAGAGGIDLVLFVIAADSSIQPQTREHFEICRLLGIRAGVIAVTKIDAADPDLLDITRLELQDLVAATFLACAPVVEVSARTGVGLDALRSALEKVARSTPARDTRGAARLPVDRAFAMKGFGTVVTGTLVSGRIAKEMQLALLPGKRLVRVRGLQTYGESADEAFAGTRTAVNIPDVEVAEIRRGMVLAQPDRFYTTRVCDCSLELLQHVRQLKNRVLVHFHCGTAETIGEIRAIGGEFFGDTTTQVVRIVLKESLVLAYGDRFIVRQFSPMVTIGGGVVLDARPSKRANERRLRVLAADDNLAKVELLIEEAPWGISFAELAQRLTITPEQASQLAREGGAVVLASYRWVLDRARVQQVAQQLIERVLEYHRLKPLSPGMPKHELRSTFADAPGFVFDSLLAAAPELKLDGDAVRHRSHRAALTNDEQAAVEKLTAAFTQGGLTPPAISDALSSTGLAPERAKAILQVLLRSGALCRINDDLILHQTAVDRLREILSSKRGVYFTVSDFKNWTGISRKYAVPLLEFADRQRLTQREGDLRTVLAVRAAR